MKRTKNKKKEKKWYISGLHDGISAQVRAVYVFLEVAATVGKCGTRQSNHFITSADVR